MTNLEMALEADMDEMLPPAALEYRRRDNERGFPAALLAGSEEQPSGSQLLPQSSSGFQWDPIVVAGSPWGQPAYEVPPAPAPVEGAFRRQVVRGHLMMRVVQTWGYERCDEFTCFAPADQVLASLSMPNCPRFEFEDTEEYVEMCAACKSECDTPHGKPWRRPPKPPRGGGGRKPGEPPKPPPPSPKPPKKSLGVIGQERAEYMKKRRERESRKK